MCHYLVSPEFSNEREERDKKGIRERDKGFNSCNYAFIGSLFHLKHRSDFTNVMVLIRKIDSAENPL